MRLGGVSTVPVQIALRGEAAVCHGAPKRAVVQRRRVVRIGRRRDGEVEELAVVVTNSDGVDAPELLAVAIVVSNAADLTWQRFADLEHNAIDVTKTVAEQTAPRAAPFEHQLQRQERWDATGAQAESCG